MKIETMRTAINYGDGKVTTTTNTYPEITNYRSYENYLVGEIAAVKSAYPSVGSYAYYLANGLDPFKNHLNGYFSIKKVIFNNPATIVLWEDGTKTVVKAINEKFDPEKGIAMAFTKRALGNTGHYYTIIKRQLALYYGTKLCESPIKDNLAELFEKSVAAALSLQNSTHEQR